MTIIVRNVKSIPRMKKTRDEDGEFWFIELMATLIEKQIQLKLANSKEGWVYQDYSTGGSNPVEYSPYREEDTDGSISFRGVEISWYKHSGRGQEVVLEEAMTEQDWFDWFIEVMAKVGDSVVIARNEKD